MWKFLQSDKKGEPAIFEEGKQIIMTAPCPPLLQQKCKVFSQPFTIDGTPGASRDMGIDGSVNPVEFYIHADPENDRYITRISFILGYGTTAQGFEFADSGAALGNGVLVAYFDTHGNEVRVMNPTANYSFMRGSGAPVSDTNWEARGFAATGDYGFFVNIFLKDIMPPLGVKLNRGTTERMVITIRDDCRDADLFNCQAFGFERFE